MCKSSDEPAEKVDLTQERFQDIKLILNKNQSISFDIKGWKPLIQNSVESHLSNIPEKENEEDSFQNNKEYSKEKFEKLKEEENKKKKQKIELENKIRAVDEKIADLKKMLNVDLSEQEYVQDLCDKIILDENKLM